MIKSYQELRVYKISYRLALQVHQITLEFPDFEKYELGSQLRRAATSIPVNIAEGYGKKSTIADFKRFLLIAQGSKDEVKVLLELSKDLQYINNETFEELFNQYDDLGKQLYSMIQKWV
ncbi:four helix bundle protein [Lentibacillus populi]|uniref:Four helix bundle protein n=1 Tax=Lentibacillus populi TaxID=1827502 RepID=A0A9W5U250_9BACI|nr:four helix bundle protein [Lentibacillus populi]